MNSEINIIDDLSDYNLIEYFVNILISKATGGTPIENKIYTYVRSKLLTDLTLKENLPYWIQTNRNIEQFWAMIKNKFSTYAERREFIWNEFSSILNALENKTTPIQSIKFDENHINLEWKKALERQETDPSGAITIARTLVESVLKFILDEKSINYNRDREELPDLYKKVSKSLKLAPEEHQEQIFKQILGGVSGVVSGLGSLRNKLGDAHGKNKSALKPKKRHSSLAVNLAGSMAIFLYETYINKAD